MLEALRFVQGAVAKKDFVPSLTHFRIEGGTIRSYNGALGLSSPLDLDLDCSPKATPFVKAIQTCKEAVQLHLTGTGRLSLKSGPFKALIDCTMDMFPAIVPQGDRVPIAAGFIAALKMLAPFIAEDASRQWARGILFRGQSAFATNNIVLLEHWCGHLFPCEVNVPKAAVLELLRIGEEPEFLQADETSITFNYTGERWLRAQVCAAPWPDVTKILDKESRQTAAPLQLWEAIEQLLPFVGELGCIFLSDKGIATSLEVEESSASFALPGIHTGSCFSAKQLLLLRDIVQTLDLTSYPEPSIFYGDKTRGAIVGVRQ